MDKKKVYAIDHVVITGGNCTAQGPCWYQDICPTEKASGAHAVCYAFEPGAAKRLDPKTRINKDISPTLRNNMGDNQPAVAYCMDARNAVLIPELAHTIQAKPGGGTSQNCTPNVIYQANDGVYAIDQQDIKGNANNPNDIMPMILRSGCGMPCAAACGGDQENVVIGCDLYNGELTGETAATLGANSCLSANHAGPSVLCFQLCGDRDNPSVSVSDKAYCIPANPMSDRGQAIAYRFHNAQMFENHSQDSRYTGPLKVSQTISQTFGAGGNNCPIVVEVR